MGVKSNTERMLGCFADELLAVFRDPLLIFAQPISQVRVQPKCPSDWIERGYELLAL